MRDYSGLSRRKANGIIWRGETWSFSSTNNSISILKQRREREDIPAFPGELGVFQVAPARCRRCLKVELVILFNGEGELGHGQCVALCTWLCCDPYDAGCLRGRSVPYRTHHTGAVKPSIRWRRIALPQPQFAYIIFKLKVGIIAY